MVVEAGCLAPSGRGGCHCSDRCARLYFKYGKYLEFYRNIKRYLIWKPYFAIKDNFWSEYCPECWKQKKGVRLNGILPPELYFCDECGSDFEFHRREYSKTKQFLKQINRILVYIQEGGKTNTLGDKGNQVPNALPILKGDG